MSPTSTSPCASCVGSWSRAAGTCSPSPSCPASRRPSRGTVVGPDGRLDHRAPPLFHPGGDVGYPVFTEFGADLPDLLRRAGFEVTIHFGPTTEDDLAQVFDCRKPSASA